METYFIRSVNTGHIKIGRTSGTAQYRLQCLKGTVPDKLELLRSIEGDYERQLHQYFRDKRIWGEWFKGEIDIEAGIAWALACPRNPEVEASRSSRVFNLRLTPAQYERLQSAAFREGFPMGDYARRILFPNDDHGRAGEMRVAARKANVRFTQAEKLVQTKRLREELGEVPLVARQKDDDSIAVNSLTAREEAERIKAWKAVEGHPYKCTCVKCQKSKGWRG